MQYEVVISPLYTLQWRWHLLHIIMANTALRWSSFAECMERFLGCPWMNSVYVASLCVYACIGLCQWCFMQYAVAFPRSCAPLLSDGNDALRWSSFAESTEQRVSYWPYTNSLYVYIAVCAWTWKCLLLVFDAEWGYDTSRVMSPSCMRLLLFKCTTMAITALLRLFLFVECMQRVSRWPCTNSAYVCIASYACAWTWMKSLLAFDAVLWGHDFILICHLAVSTYTAIMAMTALCWSLFV